MEELSYDELKKEAYSRGFTYHKGNPPKSVLREYLASDESLVLGSPFDASDFVEAKRPRPVRKHTRYRTANKNIQACEYCGHTHVPRQFEVCQNPDCGKDLK